MLRACCTVLLFAGPTGGHSISPKEISRASTGTVETTSTVDGGAAKIPDLESLRSLSAVFQKSCNQIVLSLPQGSKTPNPKGENDRLKRPCD